MNKINRLIELINTHNVYQHLFNAEDLATERCSDMRGISGKKVELRTFNIDGLWICGIEWAETHDVVCLPNTSAWDMIGGVGLATYQGFSTEEAAIAFLEQDYCVGQLLFDMEQVHDFLQGEAQS